MSCSSFPDPAGRLFVADASVLINLDASGFAETIITSSCGVLHGTRNAVDEVIEGERRGYGNAGSMHSLEKRGLLRVVEIGDREEPIYRALVEGSAARTLDDGEAATIAYAVENCAVALIDEKKARRICLDQYRGTPVVTTTDMMLHSGVAAALGDQHMTALHASLVHARMHVPPHLVETVVALLGNQRSLECPSLPRRIVARAAQ
ncbi:hypothetical protein SAMN05444398_11630 [Roseovarius pacificus]|uniref:PIN domain-containing protein n=1 Tax=Roseovarius pacificus TaxID=337701 RepID=A0A1M7IPW3_9RHOB|nr:hypothetical protein [Roseovarius pacificus]GGO61464.1 hypothetical protein GCM10011315_38220 [Roseovarius pacificus]SHM42770.1 hypothetical protein SAMN05444398_11630 [Roseovarius pacificus]